MALQQLVRWSPQLLPTEMTEGTPHRSPSHRESRSSHCHCAEPRLARSLADGFCCVQELKRSTAESFEAGSWVALLWRSTRPRPFPRASHLRSTRRSWLRSISAENVGA